LLFPEVKNVDDPSSAFAADYSGAPAVPANHRARPPTTAERAARHPPAPGPPGVGFRPGRLSGSSLLFSIHSRVIRINCRAPGKGLISWPKSTL
jgi:hypothetical protein